MSACRLGSLSMGKRYCRSVVDMSSSVSLGLYSDILFARDLHSSRDAIAACKFSWYVEVVESAEVSNVLRWACAEVK